jgi:zinc/manganese transport system substrate-binding protein/manganese/iron transport system substrate-binding protein
VLRALSVLALVGMVVAACGDSSKPTATAGASNASPSAAGAGSASPAAPGALKVVATTTQIADMAREIGGQLVDVTGILPPNADPHDFEPTPQDVGRIADAQLVLEHGLHLDAWSDELVKESGTHASVVVVWFDVANAKVMATNIRDAYVAADSSNRDVYTTQAAAYLAQLDELDSWIRQQIETIPAANRKLVTNHDAFGYYVAAYGLEFVGAVIPSLDSKAEPSAKDIADLVDKIKAQHVKAIFTEASLNPKLEEQIASEAGVAVVDNLYGDSLGPAGSGADTYIGMMRVDTTLIVEALK